MYFYDFYGSSKRMDKIPKTCLWWGLTWTLRWSFLLELLVLFWAITPLNWCLQHDIFNSTYKIPVRGKLLFQTEFQCSKLVKSSIISQWQWHFPCGGILENHYLRFSLLFFGRSTCWYLQAYQMTPQKINMFYTFNTSSFGHTLSYVNDCSKLRDCKLHFVTSIVHNFAIYDFYSLICSPTLKMVQKWMPCFSNNIKMEWVCTNYILNPKYCIHCWFLENSITNTKSLVLYVATRTTASRGLGQGSGDKGERKHIFDKNNQTNSKCSKMQYKIAIQLNWEPAKFMPLIKAKHDDFIASLELMDCQIYHKTSTINWSKITKVIMWDGNSPHLRNEQTCKDKWVIYDNFKTIHHYM